MIIDTLSNLERYASLNPLFPEVIKFINQHPLDTLPLGKHAILGDDLFVNIVDAQPKQRPEARLETHRQMIDIQVPLSGTEEHGWSPLSSLPEAAYDEASDISFYDGAASIYYHVSPMQMTIYFPEDAHAPAITPVTLRKAIFKVRVS